jgi:hypothetical protein
MILITREWTGLELIPEAAETLCRHADGDFRYILGYLIEVDRACTVNKTGTITVQLIETVIKRLSSKREFAGRLDREDFKKVRVVGRMP